MAISPVKNFKFHLRKFIGHGETNCFSDGQQTNNNNSVEWFKSEYSTYFLYHFQVSNSIFLVFYFHTKKTDIFYKVDALIHNWGTGKNQKKWSQNSYMAYGSSSCSYIKNELFEGSLILKWISVQFIWHPPDFCPPFLAHCRMHPKANVIW